MLSEEFRVLGIAQPGTVIPREELMINYNFLTPLNILKSISFFLKTLWSKVQIVEVAPDVVQDLVPLERHSLFKLVRLDTFPLGVIKIVKG